MKILSKEAFKLWLLAASVAAISACSGDDTIVEVPVDRIVEVEVPAPVPVPVDYIYEVSITNMTGAQILSPVALVAHESGYLWQVGSAASVALERLAEGGDNSELLINSHALSSVGGAGPIAPGASETIQITIQDNAEARLSFATMLVNTNDAFAGLNAWSLSYLSEAGMSWTTVLPALDAGTEVNSEAAGTIPGPADGGEGYNPMRNDRGIVSLHPGVVSASDGLDTSVLSVDDKFDNPSVKVTVSRLQ